MLRATPTPLGQGNWWGYSNWQELVYEGESETKGGKRWKQEGIIDYSEEIPFHERSEADQRLPEHVKAFPVYFKKESGNTVVISIVVLMVPFFCFVGGFMAAEHFKTSLTSTQYALVVATGAAIIPLGMMAKHAIRIVGYSVHIVVRVVFIDWIEALYYSFKEGKGAERYRELWLERLENVQQIGNSIETMVFVPVFTVCYLAANALVLLDIPSRIATGDSQNGIRAVARIEKSLGCRDASFVEAAGLAQGPQDRFQPGAPTFFNGCYQPLGYVLVQVNEGSDSYVASNRIRTWSTRDEPTYQIIKVSTSK